MMNKDYGNYTGKALDFLKKYDLEIWSKIKAHIEDFTLNGLVAPAPQDTSEVLFMKLPNGYNTAFSVQRIHNVEVKGREAVEYKIPPKKVEKDPDIPNVHILGAGGTVASKVDYRTGAVKASFSTSEIIRAIPELTDIANIDSSLLFNIFSENMTPNHWQQLAKNVAKVIKSEIDGVIITHGTDTMHYTAAALSFMLKNLPKPVVLTGSQRSSDRPASDAPSNLKASARLAGKGDIAEVQVCMHATQSDERFFAHRGTRVRKMHSSRRDTFRSLSTFPLAEVKKTKVTYLRDYTPREKNQLQDFHLDPAFEEKVALVWMYPGFDKAIIERLIDKQYQGIVIGGTGLGHTPKTLYSTIKRGIEEGIHFVMTTQCLNGRVDMNVYETGRDLIQLGVISGKSMLPSVAYVKLGWILGHNWSEEKMKKMLQTNLSGEIESRESPAAFFKQPMPPK